MSRPDFWRWHFEGDMIEKNEAPKNYCKKLQIASTKGDQKLVKNWNKILFWKITPTGTTVTIWNTKLANYVFALKQLRLVAITSWMAREKNFIYYLLFSNRLPICPPCLPLLIKYGLKRPDFLSEQNKNKKSTWKISLPFSDVKSVQKSSN